MTARTSARTRDAPTRVDRRLLVDPTSAAEACDALDAFTDELDSAVADPDARTSDDTCVLVVRITR